MSRRRRSRLAAVAQPVLALAVLVGLLVGVPVLLLEMAEWPITGVPTAEQLRRLPETAVTDEALFAVLTVGAWGAWAVFAFSVAVEAAARATGRAASVNVGGPLQRLAARLVGSLLLGLGTVGTPVLGPLQAGPAGAIGAEAVAGPVVATAPAAPGATGTTAAPGAETAGPQGPVVVVRARQALSPQEAGPGRPGQPPPAPGSVVVQPGDHFWGLAKTTLTQAWGRVPADDEMVGYWLDLVEANRHLLRPPHDPDLVYPDQVFNLPPRPPDPTRPAQPAPAPPPPATPAPEAPPTDGVPDDVVPDDVVPDQPGEATPGQPEDTAPDQGGETSPEQPEATAPDSTGETTPDGEEEAAPGPPDESSPEETTDPTLDEDGGTTETSPEETTDSTLDEDGGTTETSPDETTDTTPDETTDTTPDETTDTTQDETSDTTQDESGETPPDSTGDTAPDQDEQAPAEPPGDHGPPVVDEDGLPTEDPENPPTTDTTLDEEGGPGDPDGSGDTAPDEDESGSGGTTPDNGAEGEGGSPDATAEEQQPDPGTGEPDGETTDTTPGEEDGTGGDAGDPEAGTGDTVPGGRDGRGVGTGDPEAGTGDTVPGGRDGGVGGPPGSAGTGDGEAAPDGTPASSQEEADDGGGFPVLLVGCGIALGGALLLLDRRRRAQQRFRPAGKRIRMPQGSLAETEQSFRQAADVDGAQLVDVALRAAAGRSEATGLPALRWVEASDDGTVTLVLGAPVPPPPGFEWEGRDRWVSTASSEELAALAANMDVPAPALVPVGTTEDGTDVLVDLESSGVVEVSGRPAAAAALLRSVALAATTSRWVDEARVMLVGIGGELANHDQVTLCATLSEALAEAEQQRDRVAEALRALRCQTTREARAVSANPSRWAPLVVVSAVPARTPEEQQRLARLAERADVGVAFVLPASDEASDADVGRFTLGDDGVLRVSGVDPDLRPHILDGEGLGAVAELLDVAADREGVEPEPADDPAARERVRDRDPGRDAAMDAEEAWGLEDPDPGPGRDAAPRTGPASDPERAPAGPDEPGDEIVPGELPEGVPDETVSPTAGALATAAAGAAASGPAEGLAALMADVDVVVRVLGEVEVVRRAGESWDGTRRLEVSRPKVLEVISYLAMRDTAVEREDLEIALFPDGSSAPKTVYNLISVARKVLGDDLFPVSDGRRYRLSERIVTDYALFYELIAEAGETGDRAVKAELLAESLDLVMGEPFLGAGRGFAWVGPHRGVIVAQVIDAAEELAEIHLASGDWRAAEWAARKGLRAFPTDERMYRILMRTAGASGNVPGVHRVFRELLQVIADPDAGVGPEDSVHPETLALLEDLTGAGPGTRRSAS